MHHSTVIDDSGDLSNPDRCTQRLYETVGRVASGVSDKLLRDLDPETLIAAAMLRPLAEREAAALLRHLLTVPRQTADTPLVPENEAQPDAESWPEWKRPADATTAALERKVAEREAARYVEEAANAARQIHGRCGGELVMDGKWGKCRKCGSSWLAKPSARPQSAWVPDSERGVVPAAPGRSIEELMREVFLEVTAVPGPSMTALVPGVLDLLTALREHSARGHDFVTLRLSEVLP
jgi:hypothetical protein